MVQVPSTIWHGLPAEIDGRWHRRFGQVATQLRHGLLGVKAASDHTLPLGFVRPTRLDGIPVGDPTGPVIAASDLPLPALLARTLVALTREVESTLDVQLSLVANVLRSVAGGRATGRTLAKLTGMASNDRTQRWLKFAIQRELVQADADGNLELTAAGGRSIKARSIASPRSNRVGGTVTTRPSMSCERL